MELRKAREDVSDDNIFKTKVRKSRGPRLRRVNFSTADDEDTDAEVEGNDVPAKGD